MESQELIQRIDELTRKVEAITDPAARSDAVELLQSLMEFHGAGLERMLEIAAERGVVGHSIIEDFARDELIGGMLLLYGLHPLELETRVRQAIDKVRPSLASHGGDVELLSIEEGVVRVRLQSKGGSCASTATTQKQTIEAAIYDAAPDLVALEVEGLAEQSAPAGLVQLGRLKSKSEGRTA
ncbi:MAG: NifU family protein [Acidobacteria bacterium]|nr:NifU family protein [Acidobacteriota bacterium]